MRIFVRMHTILREKFLYAEDIYKRDNFFTNNLIVSSKTMEDFFKKQLS